MRLRLGQRLENSFVGIMQYVRTPLYNTVVIVNCISTPTTASDSGRFLGYIHLILGGAWAIYMYLLILGE